MPFHYSHFGTTPLPDLDGDHDIGTGTVDLGETALSDGGSYVPFGRKSMQSLSVNARGLILGTSATLLRTTFLQLRALIGTRDQLWRLWSDGTREWTWAWVREAPASRSARDPLMAQQTTLALFIEKPIWYSETEHVLRLTDFYDANGGDLLLMGVMGLTPGSAIPVVIENKGYIEGHNMTVTVTSGSGTVSTFDLDNTTTDYAFGWDGSLTAGQVLQIITGGQKVTKNNVGDYANFTPPDNHSQWMALAPGLNTLSISLTDTATDDLTAIEIRYYDTNP